jgi:hypothetical protein
LAALPSDWAKPSPLWLYQPQLRQAEIRHGAGRRADGPAELRLDQVATC